MAKVTRPKKSPVRKTKSRKPVSKKKSFVLLVGTRKGAFFLKGDGGRKSWKLTGPHFLGHVIHHMVLDPRDGKTLLLATRTGHLGPTVFRSTNWGKTWTEAATPPRFQKAPEGETGRVVDHVFWLQPAHPSEPNVWYAGTSPQGLFRSTDGGVNWESVRGFNEHRNRKAWCGGDQDGTPDGPKTHSILIDPRDPKHMYIGLSGGGVFESTDKGNDWKPLNAGSTMDFMPNPEGEFGQDPHLLAMARTNPDRLWQQNHCGIYRMDRAEAKWVRVGKNMPKAIGDIGFPVVIHPSDEDTAWVFPMDGTEVWPRTSPGGKPAVFQTKNAGKSWKRKAKGLPKAQGWFTVKRQAFVSDTEASVGLYFGTTSGEIWASRDGGDSWKQIAAHLPHVYSIEVAGVGR